MAGSKILVQASSLNLAYYHFYQSISGLHHIGQVEIHFGLAGMGFVGKWVRLKLCGARLLTSLQWFHLNRELLCLNILSGVSIVFVLMLANNHVLPFKILGWFWKGKDVGGPRSYLGRILFVNYIKTLLMQVHCLNI